MIKFRKMHGLGNDFVIMDAIPLKKMDIQRICDRNRGVGCDQLIVLEPSARADIFMRIYNPDGSQAGACGNATRCVADIVMTDKGQKECTIETVSGILSCRHAGEKRVTVDMGVPKVGRVDLAGDPVTVDVGNPHCVFFVEDAQTADVAGIGPSIETHPLFLNRTNVEFVSVLGKDHLRMRVWERGAGITQACGTGACASAVAAITRGLTGRKVTVTLDGGDLTIEWREADGHIFMTGPLEYVFEGTILI